MAKELPDLKVIEPQLSGGIRCRQPLLQIQPQDVGLFSFRERLPVFEVKGFHHRVSGCGSLFRAHGFRV